MKKSRFSLAILAVILATASAFVAKANRPYANVFTGLGGTSNCNPKVCVSAGTIACSMQTIWKDPGCSTRELVFIHKP